MGFVFRLVLLLALVGVMAPLASAQNVPRRIGLLLLDAACPGPVALRDALAALGWVEGRNIAIDCVSSVGQSAEVPALAKALVARHPDVLVSGYLPAIRALTAATSTIPIVMINAADPVRWRLIKSLARPGTNVTGLASLAAELDGKRFELLKELVPGVKRVAILARPTRDEMALDYYAALYREAERAGARLGFGFAWFDVAAPSETRKMFATIAAQKFDAVYLAPGPVFVADAGRVARVAKANGLPTVGFSATLAETGVLFSYSTDNRLNLRRVAAYVDRILKGANPAELPVEQPSEFQLVINLATAKALKITVPPALLVRATKLVEK